MDEQDNIQQPSCLEGLRVIDFTHFISGPYCSRLMADLGAEVIKVEPPAGDIYRTYSYQINGVSGNFSFRNAGKKGLCLNLRHPKAVEVFKDLARVSDIVVQNRRLGVLDSMGLGYEELRKVNPRIIMCSVSAYGQTGPLAEWPGGDPQIQAMSGVGALGGHPDGPPLPTWVPWVDFSTGATAMAAIGAALYYRDMTGEGQHIDLSMFDVAFTFHDYPVEEYLMSDGKVNRTRNGPHHFSTALTGVFKCRDDYLYIASEGNFRGLAEIMGRPELVTDPRFDTRLHRLDNRDEIVRIVADWIKDFDMADVRLVLETNGIIALPILSVEEAIHHPHVEARELLVEVDDPRAGRIKVSNIPIKFSDTKARARGPAPMLGQHNEEILSRILDYGKERIEELWREKVLHAEEAVADLAGR